MKPCTPYLTALLFALVGCSIQVGVEPPTPTADPIPATSAAAGLDATYIHPQLGYAFDYPSGWNVYLMEDQTVILGSAPYDTMGGLQLPPGATKIDFYPSTTLTLDEMVAGVHRGDEMGSFEILSEEMLTLPSGLQAASYEIAGTGSPVAFYTIVSGQGLSANGFGDVSRFDAIMMSLRPASAESQP